MCACARWPSDCPTPVLAATNHHHCNASLALEPFTVIDRAGIRVGIVGLAAVVATHLLPPDERREIEVTTGEAVLRMLIPSLRHDRGA